MSSSINSSARQFITFAAISGALAVCIGAFGAHALKPFLLENGRFETFGTAVSYHFYHTFALVAVGILLIRIESKLLKWAGYCYIIGMLLFSGSLYILSLATDLSYFGIITPIGGLFFIVGWFLLLWSVRTAEPKSPKS